MSSFGMIWCFGAAFAMLLSLSCARAGALEFSAAGTFKILQLTDLHFGADRGGDARTRKLMIALIDRENPDLVVLSGDVVTGDAWKVSDGTKKGWFENQWDHAVSPMTERGVPYAMILGNHDTQAYLGADAIVAYDMGGEFSLTQGRDYYLDVGTTHRIWFFDSGNDRCHGRKSWGCVREEAIEWAREQTPAAFSVAFVHIPIPQMSPGYLKDKKGERHEPVSSARTDAGVMRFATEQGVRGIFHGHDHGNDYAGVTKKEGVMLAYGRSTGYGGYTVDRMAKGARVIVLRQNASHALPETWILLEDGNRVDYNGFSDIYARNVREFMVVATIFFVCACVAVWWAMRVTRCDHRRSSVEPDGVHLI